MIDEGKGDVVMIDGNWAEVKEKFLEQRAAGLRRKEDNGTYKKEVLICPMYGKHPSQQRYGLD